jgi:hypothetical protein
VAATVPVPVTIASAPVRSPAVDATRTLPYDQGHSRISGAARGSGRLAPVVPTRSPVAETNTAPDTHPSYEDIAYGGAGRDVLIGNTGGDRLIDWAGEFNSYVVPFSPFGIATVSRSHQPDLTDYLYQLSASDGADPTRDTDEDLPDNDPRNGEPFGELGLVLPQDDDWNDQTGGPADPQPGNDKGKKDVKTTASTEPTILIFNEVTGELIVNGEVAADEDWIIDI